MRRSKLEIYVDILKVLVHWRPLKFTHIMYKANLNSIVLEEYLAFLIKQGIVEAKILSRERKIYAITQHGITVLEQFRELKEVLPTDEGTQDEVKSHKPYLY